MNQAERNYALNLLRNNHLAGAETLLSRLCKENPSDHEAWLLSGIVARQQGNLNKAISYFKNSIKWNPKTAETHIQLGLAFRDKGLTREAITSFHTALDILPSSPEGHKILTDTLLAENRDDELIFACQDALNYLPNDLGIRCKLAVALERSHQLDDARREAEEILRIAPDHARAALTTAKIDKRSGNLTKARDRLEQLSHTQLTPPQLSAVLSELGDVLDKLGDYSGAYAAFHASNEAMMKMASSLHIRQDTIFNMIDHYKTVFTADFTRNWAEEEPDDGLPSPIFLVGFPRSGTTLTEQIISACGNIIPSDEKPVISRLIGEMNSVLSRKFIYPDELDSLSTYELKILRHHYWHLVYEMVSPDIGKNRLLDKLPLNLLEVAFIFRLFPQSPIVFVLRDPRDCCLSAFMRGFVPNAAMINFSTLEQAARFYSAVMGYWLHIRAVMDIRYIEIRYEDLVADMETTARDLISHIGEEWNDGVLHFYMHARKQSVRTPSYSDIAKPIYKNALGRWRNYEPHMTNALGILEPYIKKLGYTE